MLLFEDAAGVPRAVVDTDGTGDLRARAPMAPYKVEAQVGEFGFGTALSFCVQARSAGEGGVGLRAPRGREGTI